MKKKMLLTLSVLLIGNVFAACMGADASEANKIVIGYQPNDEIQILEQSQHFVENEFAEDGVEVEWVEFAYGATLVEALAAGSIDVGGNLGDTPFTNALANNVPIQGIFLNAYDPNLYTILLSDASSQEIESVEDLEGKKIALLAGSAGEDFLAKELEGVGLSLSDVEVINISSTEDQYTALSTGDVDAVISLDPLSSVFVYENGGSLLDYGDPQKQVITFGVANTDFAEANPELVAKFVKAKILADEYVEANREEYKEIYAEVNEYPVEALDSIDRLTFRREFEDSDYDALNATMEFMLETGALDFEVDYTGTLTNEYLEEAERLLAEE